jgi:hypothetical protein
MFGSTVIEVGIGLVSIYFLISIICTNINDFIARLLNLRAKELETGIRNLLGDPELMNKVWNHALVRGIVGKRGKAPTYIPPNTFALALFDAIAPAANRPGGLDTIRAMATKLPESSARHWIVNVVDQANKNMQAAQKSVEDWYNDAMDQVSQEYKLKMIYLSIFVAGIVTVILGVDSIAIANTLYREPAVRAAVANAAQTTSSIVMPSADVSKNVAATIASLDSLMLPIGWNQIPATPGAWGQKIVGMLLTTLAASLGAPFWYDLLRNLMNLFNRDK